MSEHTENPEATGHGDGRDAAATEAAQNAVDETTSWEYSAEKDTIAEDLDEGLEQAGVTVEPAERQRLVDAIDGVKEDEHSGGPDVDPTKVSPADEG